MEAVLKVAMIELKERAAKLERPLATCQVVKLGDVTYFRKPSVFASSNLTV